MSRLQRILASPWLPATIGALALVLFAIELKSGRASVAPLSSEEAAQATVLLGGLAEGDEVAGWRVDGVESLPGGAIRVWVARGDVRWAADVVRSGEGPGHAPRSTGKHDLFYGHVRPEGAKVNPAETFLVLDALAKRVERAEESH